MKQFYNTIDLKAKELTEALSNAKRQEEGIVLIFRIMKVPMTPAKVHQHYVENIKDIPITSVRRAMTNLTEQRVLKKTDKQEDGNYGKPNYKWQLSGEFPERCKTHKEKLGYMAWMDKADRLTKAGVEQTQCVVCGRYLFPDEL